MKVQYEERSVVECGERFHDQRHTFCCVLFSNLWFCQWALLGDFVAKCTTYVLFTWREKNKTLWLRDAKHEGLDFELRTTTDYRVEIDSKHTREFAVVDVSIICCYSGKPSIGNLRGFCRRFCLLENVECHCDAVRKMSKHSGSMDRVLAIIPSCER